jgi:uncharacterized repeat protein (TIGR01451 family)
MSLSLQKILRLFVQSLFLFISMQTLWAGPDLELLASAAPDPAMVGSELTYSIIVTNHGDVAAAEIATTATLSASFEITGAEASMGAAEITNHSVMCSFAALGPAEGMTIEIRGIPKKAEELIFTGLVLGKETEAIMYNNSFTFQTEARGVANEPPIVSLSSPAENSVADSLSEIKIESDASDPEGSLASVEFFVNEFKVAERSSPPFSVSLPELRPGEFTITVRARDVLGAESATEAHLRVVTASTNAFARPWYVNGAFHCYFPGDYGREYRIEAESPGGNWEEVFRLTKTNLSSELIDPSSQKARFYRAVEVPD